MPNIAWKCRRCGKFFGTPMEERSYILVHNLEKGVISTYDICEDCFLIIHHPLLVLLGIIPPPAIENKGETIIDAEIENTENTEAVSQEVSEKPDESAIPETPTENSEGK